MSEPAKNSNKEIKYQRYKDIEFFIERVSFPDTLKIAGVPWQEGFGNINDYHNNYKNKMPNKYEPYTDAEISFFNKDYGQYIFGCRVNSIENLPEGVIGIDTGYKEFDILTFRAVDWHTLVGGADGPGDAMKTASEYTREVWYPKHKNEIELYDNDKMCYMLKINDIDYGCGGIGIYMNSSQENPEMCNFLPLKANREQDKINEHIKKI